MLFAFLHASPSAALERKDESIIRSTLQQYSQRLNGLGKDFNQFAKSAKGDTSYNLLFESYEADSLAFNVYHVRTILDLAIIAELNSDEEAIRFVLVREANDLNAVIDQAISSRKKARMDFLRTDYLKSIDEFSAVLRDIRAVAERIALEK
jgi:hypothetical protein